MTITQSKRKSKQIKAFSKRVWEDANKEHYGENISFDNHEIVLIARKNNIIVGMLSARLGNGVVYIRELLVDYSYQGKGIGKTLFHQIEEIAKEKKYHKIYLETGKGWKAEKFYLANGFEKTTELKNHYHNKDFVLYMKFI